MMLSKIVLYFVAFFAFIGIFSTYSYHFNILTPFISAIIILVSLVASFYTIKSEKLEHELILHKKTFFLLISLVILSIAVMIFPSMVFPFTTSDFMNHASFVKNTAKNSGSAIFLEILSNPSAIFEKAKYYYMATYIATSSVFYNLIQNTYIVNTILPIIFHLLTILLLFLLTKRLFVDEKVALLAFFIYGFSVVSFLLFIGGFLPQIMGTLFFVASIYCYSINKKKLLVLSNIALMAYPTFLIGFFIFLILEFLRNRNLRIFYCPLIALLVMLPEVILLAVGQSYMLTGYLIRGGITTPNPFSWPIFFFVIIGLFLAFKDRKIQENHRILWHVTLAVALMVASVFGLFALNLFTKIQEVQIHQLYMAVKYFYLMIIPLSILAAIGIFWLLSKCQNNKQYYKIALTIVGIMIGYHFIYGFNYSFVIKQNEVFPAEFYSIAEKLDNLSPGFTVGIDECFLKMHRFTIFDFPYYNFFDNPGELETAENKARYAVIGRALHFSWANSKQTIKGYWEIFDDQNTLIVKYGSQDVNYFITNCSFLDKPIYLQEGTIKVHKIK